ncbi:hypothetical protein D3C71_1172090 [compost metagenome]
MAAGVEHVGVPSLLHRVAVVRAGLAERLTAGVFSRFQINDVAARAAVVRLALHQRLDNLAGIVVEQQATFTIRHIHHREE